MIPHDFLGRDLIAERHARRLGRISERATIWLSAAAFVLMAAHASINFITWETTTVLAAHESRAAVMGDSHE